MEDDLAEMSGLTLGRGGFGVSGLRAACAAGTPAPGQWAVGGPSGGGEQPAAPRKGPSSFPSRVQVRVGQAASHPAALLTLSLRGV